MSAEPCARCGGPLGRARTIVGLDRGEDGIPTRYYDPACAPLGLGQRVEVELGEVAAAVPAVEASGADASLVAYLGEPAGAVLLRMCRLLARGDVAGDGEARALARAILGP